MRIVSREQWFEVKLLYITRLLDGNAEFDDSVSLEQLFLLEISRH